jgi:hypothetical protein
MANMSSTASLTPSSDPHPVAVMLNDPGTQQSADFTDSATV